MAPGKKKQYRRRLNPIQMNSKEKFNQQILDAMSAFICKADSVSYWQVKSKKEPEILAFAVQDHITAVLIIKPATEMNLPFIADLGHDNGMVVENYAISTTPEKFMEIVYEDEEYIKTEWGHMASVTANSIGAMAYVLFATTEEEFADFEKQMQK